MTFEGTEGSGKSTQVELLGRALSGLDPVVVREPGGTPLGERVRELLLHGDAITPQAETFLFMAARAELLARVIEPTLASGRVVIADRYHDSTLAYQGGGRGAAVAWPDHFPRPDLTFLLALPAEAGLARLDPDGSARDRMESEGIAFHRAVGIAYDRLAAGEPGRFVRLDATRPPEEIHQSVLDRVASRLKGAVTSS